MYLFRQDMVCNMHSESSKRKCQASLTPYSIPSAIHSGGPIDFRNKKASRYNSKGSAKALIPSQEYRQRKSYNHAKQYCKNEVI